MGGRILNLNLGVYIIFVGSRAPWQFPLLRRVQMPMANLKCSLLDDVDFCELEFIHPRKMTLSSPQGMN